MGISNTFPEVWEDVRISGEQHSNISYIPFSAEFGKTSASTWPLSCLSHLLLFTRGWWLLTSAALKTRGAAGDLAGWWIRKSRRRILRNSPSSLRLHLFLPIQTTNKDQSARVELRNLWPACSYIWLTNSKLVSSVACNLKTQLIVCDKRWWRPLVHS